VPYTRGEEVSRPCDDILFEIAQLAAQGVREVNLLGQNVNAWRGENYDGTTGSFADLLRLARHRRHRPHSLHHQPPDRIYRRYHRRLSRYAGW
jgi:tRNA A37 methylthiotransferase MiaB